MATQFLPNLGIILKNFSDSMLHHALRKQEVQLGLAIAKEIVTTHGGVITAQSEETKTTFTVVLPVGNL